MQFFMQTKPDWCCTKGFQCLGWSARSAFVCFLFFQLLGVPLERQADPELIVVSCWLFSAATYSLITAQLPKLSPCCWLLLDLQLCYSSRWSWLPACLAFVDSSYPFSLNFSTDNYFFASRFFNDVKPWEFYKWAWFALSKFLTSTLSLLLFVPWTNSPLIYARKHSCEKKKKKKKKHSFMLWAKPNRTCGVFLQLNNKCSFISVEFIF